MPVVAVGDILLVRAVCSTQGQVGVNTGYLNCTAKDGTDVTTTDIAKTIESNAAAKYTPMLPEAARWEGLSVQKIWPLPRDVAGISVTNAGPGDVSSNVLPTQVCGIFTKRTSLAGPKYRGRMYVPFPPESFLDTDGTPTLAYITLLTALATLWTEGPNTFTNIGLDGTVTCDWVLWHRESHAVTNITGAHVRKKWATQRRRGDYGQPNQLPF